MRYLDRGLSILLVLGAAGHTLGVLGYYHGQPDALFWSLSATLLILLLAAINWLRSDRPADRGLAWVAAVASAAYAGQAVALGVYLAHDLLDLRAVIFALVALGLTGVSLRTALAR